MKRKRYVSKNKNGITLVALVVTIIVLIILAGVSISLVLGNNGIVTKAKLAKEQTEQAKLNEEEQINSAVNYSETLGGNSEERDYAPYDNPYIPTGFEHVGGTTWNSGFTIKGSDQNTNDEFVWVPCVTDQAKVKEGDTVVTFGRILPKMAETTDRYYKYNQNQLTNITDGDSSGSEIRKSVEKYGGFYIAKYEAGIEEIEDNYTLTTKTKVDGSVKPLSQNGRGVWNDITRTDAITVSKGMINQQATGVKSSLISGEAWDTTLQWMVNASENRNNEPNKNYDINSEGKGYYKDTPPNNTKYITGYYAVNNIYDMAGKVWEWTTENCTYGGDSYVVFRGGSYSDLSADTPVAYRGYYENSRDRTIAFRVVLYK